MGGLLSSHPVPIQQECMLDLAANKNLSVASNLRLPGNEGIFSLAMEQHMLFCKHCAIVVYGFIYIYMARTRCSEIWLLECLCGDTHGLHQGGDLSTVLCLCLRQSVLSRELHGDGDTCLLHFPWCGAMLWLQATHWSHHLHLWFILRGGIAEMPTVIPHLLLWPHYEIIGFIFLPSIYSVSPLTDFLGNWVHTDVFRSNACQNHIFFFCFLGMFFFFFYYYF